MDNKQITGSERFQSRLSGGIILDNIRKLRDDFKNLYQVLKEFIQNELKNKEISICSSLENEVFENNSSEKECEAMNINTINFPLQLSSKKLSLTKENLFDKYGKTVNSCDNLGKLMFSYEGNQIDSLTTNTFSGRNTEKKEFTNSNFNKESSKRNGTSVFETYNINFLNLEPSLKPRKGDKTPLSNFLEESDLDEKNEDQSKESNVNFKKEEFKKEIEVIKPKIKKIDIKSKEVFHSFNRQSDILFSGKGSIIGNKKRNVSVEHPDIKRQLVNEIDGKKSNNELLVSNVQINGNSHFMERMFFDIYKRQTKEERLKGIVDKKKFRKNDSEITKTFNRLIKDSNRRLEASNKMDKIKEILNKDLTKVSKRRFKENDWESYYTKSVKNFSENREKKIKDQQIEKEKIEKEKEEKIIKVQKIRKVSNQEIDLIFKKIYERKNVSKVIFEKNIRKKTSESEKLMEFSLSPTSPNNKYSSRKDFIVHNQHNSVIFQFI